MDWDRVRIFLAVARSGQILGSAQDLASAAWELLLDRMASPASRSQKVRHLTFDGRFVIRESSGRAR